MRLRLEDNYEHVDRSHALTQQWPEVHQVSRPGWQLHIMKTTKSFISHSNFLAGSITSTNLQTTLQVVGVFKPGNGGRSVCAPMATRISKGWGNQMSIVGVFKPSNGGQFMIHRESEG